MASAPLPYAPNQGGYYSVAKRYGEYGAISANSVVASLKWPKNLTGKLLLRALRIAVDVSSSFMAPLQMAFRARKVRKWNADWTANAQYVDMETVQDTNMDSTIMGESQLLQNGPCGSSNGNALTGASYTADQEAFAITPVRLFVPVSLTAAYSMSSPVPQGSCSDKLTLFEWTPNGHPKILGPLEGIVIESVFAGPPSGAFGLYVEWDWCEQVGGFA